MQQDFEIKKRNLKEDSEKVTVRLSVELMDHLRENTESTLKELIESAGYSDRIATRGDKLFFKAWFIKEMFRPSIQSIIRHVEEVLQKPNVDNRVNKILMVGGFSESPVVREAIKEAFSSRICVVAPAEPGLAVLKGAVLFGHSPSAISTRVSRYTYGVAVTTDFNPNMHAQSSLFVDQNGRQLCRDVFSKIVTTGENVDSDDWQLREYVIMDRMRPLDIAVYASEADNPILVTDPGTHRLGVIEVKKPIGGWRSGAKLKVEMMFGGTELSVRATEVQTQIQQEASFDFLSKQL